MTPIYRHAGIDLYVGDCRNVLASLPDGCVQTVVTSPPYFGLRSYLDADHPDKAAEIGTEQTPDAFVAALVAVFREVGRILRDDGTVFLNLGDSYAGSGKGGQSEAMRSENWQPDYANKGFTYGLKAKDLIGIPWMTAFALRADGWYLRSAITWCKSNPMPESVVDRPTSATEMVFLLSKKPHYYYDQDAIREPHQGIVRPNFDGARGTLPKGNAGNQHDRCGNDPAGRNRRNWWLVNTIPYPNSHFATFPPKLIEPMILAGTSAKGACPECGAAWRRVTEHTKGDNEATERPKRTAGMDSRTSTLSLSGNGSKEWAKRGGKTQTTGWEPSCTCGHTETVPCVVLDCFAGAGTSLLVAKNLGRAAIGIELSESYCDLIVDRLRQDVLPLAL